MACVLGSILYPRQPRDDLARTSDFELQVSQAHGTQKASQKQGEGCSPTGKDSEGVRLRRTNSRAPALTR